MSDSPRRGLHKGAQVISPQPINDRSIIDSVAGLINDIVPQAYAGTPNPDNKESITWARFEYADINNSAFYPDYIEGSTTPPLLLVLGYATGVQVWVIGASGEATEVLSWRQGIVRTLRILPSPKTSDDLVDPFEHKRPMVAICDSAGTGAQFCSISFISLKTSEQTKSIKFKNPVCDVLANKRSVVVTFSEKIAVFDARTLEDVLTVTTCYPSPGPNPNPVALGTRWLAYSEKKLLPARRSSGGSEGEGVQSYTATVLYAAKSLGKGLRGLGETVASSLTGNSTTPMTTNNVGGDVTQPGVITILDLQAAKEEKDKEDPTIDTVVAHFTAHNDAIVAMTFDLTGALLMTADKRGHDFHVFRIQPHPGGPTLAAVHHLYVLHRGDTTAKVQDMTFSSDTRWAAVSTVRGTTHVFPVAPYGGPVGVRTHSTPHVVNRLSRFHRSAGLTDDGTRSHSPVSHAELPLSVYPYSNPRLPPYPHPTILHPLAQIRQPSTLNHSNTQSQPSRPQQRQRLHSDDNGTLPLKICACFAPPRAWIYAQRDSTNKVAKRTVDSLFIMACHGNMIQYDLEVKPTAGMFKKSRQLQMYGVPKEKVCDDTTIELEVEPKGQWPLLRTPNSLEIVPPLPSSSPLLSSLNSPRTSKQLDTADDRWLSQVEIVTHAGPHRRLWMGPQFVFKTYNAPSGVNLVESEAIEIGVTGGSRPARSNPVNMPHAATRPLVPVVIDGSGSSYEQSPRFMEAYGDSLENDTMGLGNGEHQLREDLAEAMLETSAAPHRVPGRRLVVERVGQPVTKVVNPLGTVITVMADEDDVTSSQEFDDATPEPPRSVCAEEGPASLGDFDNEGQDLKNLTEICAEMRSASEPAIDSVPDESIRDVKEHKSLCVEAATMNPGRNAIDYEREEAFRDVPTSLSLCAEQGEIPSSPMTQARENTWNKRTAKREDSELQERTFAKAKYVVNYDEDSVVLMENKATEKPIQQKQQQCKEGTPSGGKDSPRVEGTLEPDRASKRPNKLASSTRANKRSICGVGEQPKYRVHEQEDSIIIEDTTMPQQKQRQFKKIENERTEEPEVSKSVVTEQHEKAEAMVVESRPVDEKIEPIESFVDLKDVEINAEEPMEATVATGMPSLPPPLEDISCMDYHVVEASLPVYSHQSDDDIEHIHSSEVTQMLEIVDMNKPERCDDFEISPERQRKSSKSTISDDDLEHIHSSEIAEVLERGAALMTAVKSFAMERNDADDFHRVARPAKNVLAFDEDVEHVYHSEVSELEPAIDSLSPKTSGSRKSPEALVADRAPSIRSRGSRKRKDVVVIDNDTSEAEVTVIMKSVEGWNKSKTPEKDLAEEIDRCVEPKDLSDQTTSQSLPKKTRVRTTKMPSTSSTIQKRQSQPASDMIEIIDIDAMQKAEMEVASECIVATPECKILEPPVRGQKSRRNKKAHIENIVNVETSCVAKPNIRETENSGQSSISWSSVVRKPESSAEVEGISTAAESEFSLDVPSRGDSRGAAINNTDNNAKLPEDSTVAESQVVEASKTCEIPEKISDSKKRGKKTHVCDTIASGSTKNVSPLFSMKALPRVPLEENITKQLPVADISEVLPIKNIPIDLPPVVENPSTDVPSRRGSRSRGKQPQAKGKKNPKMNEDPENETPPPMEATSAPPSEKISLEPEAEPEQEKRGDSDQEVAPEPSSSSDDLNANVVPMDTEEDSAVREIAEKNGSTGASPSWSTVNKKNIKSKKKKRR